MIDALTAEDVSARLIALRQEMEANIWPTATAAAQSGDHERVRDLVKLKVDIEAIDFALSHRPVEAAPTSLPGLS